MATQLQIRRGTTSQMNAFTGAEGELAVNTTTDTVHVHDGSTAGGFALAKADGSNIGTYAGSFTTLAASGAVTLSSTLAVSGALTVDTNTLVVDATNNRVGINTSPSYQLDLKQADSYAASFENPSDDSKLLLGEVSGDWRLAATYGSTGSFKPITFWTSDQKRLTIDASGEAEFSGKVRVGTSTNGTAALMTFDSASNSSALQMGNNSGGAYPGGVLLYSTSSNEFQIYQYSGVVGSETYGGPTLALNSAGNMGIGVVPSAWRTAYADKALDLGTHSALYDQFGGSTFLANNFYRSNDNSFKYKTTRGATAISLDAGQIGFLTAPSGTAGATATLTTRMILDASGSLLVGGTAAGTVSGNNAMITVRRDSGNCGISYQSGSAATDQWETYSNLGAQFYIENTSTSNGAYLQYNSGSGWTNVSDERWKTNWTSLEDSSSKIAALNVGKYQMLNDLKESIEGAKWDYGVKAQELLEVIPDAVDVPENPEDKYGVVPNIVFWHAVKAIQEQQATIKALTQRIATLENN